MRYIARSAVLATMALGIALAPGTGSAGAAQTGSQSLYAPSALVLTVTAGEDALNGSVLRAVTLSCAPTASGTHPDPGTACAELRAAGARFDAITTADSGVMCTRQWDPVTVTADGVWDGKRVSFAHTFGNACLKNGADGVVFGF
ncbi:subtilase-type protease inhibitor [Streptomyces sp. ISL-10]|uniref:subtilase-type protease inhibitor n=1 Tax=Streptomyces sp. ISL-10 TaxID=2819172 RepID=UPI001BEBCFD9|nr:subtilase-type protease inhibitor [Streptomyces sp. ISL-10]MBT2364180.1 subtilase-type protease inhibitor [Streptomyces sp. ISL-10]